MAITVNPPVETDQVTGEEVAVDPASRVIKTGVDAAQNTVQLEEYSSPFDPEFQKIPQGLTDPAFRENATDQDLKNFWTGTRPLNQTEIDHLQDQYIRRQDEGLAKLFNYRMTGNTAELTPDQMESLGITEESDGYERFSTDKSFGYDDFSPEQTQEIDNYILTSDAKPDAQIAQQVINADIGKSDAAVVVQHLAQQFYSGQLSLQEAYFKAGTSGISEQRLYKAFSALNHKLQSS
tara:strand:+ start:764 stop:1471 length:708 start_codon:yes stop_codon:yes gene_type:complete